MTLLTDRADYELGWFDAFRVDATGAPPHDARTRAAMPFAYSAGVAAYVKERVFTTALIYYRGPDPREVRLVCQAAVARYQLVTKRDELPELADAADEVVGWMQRAAERNTPDPDRGDPQ